eukprot:s2478_g2.t1
MPDASHVFRQRVRRLVKYGLPLPACRCPTIHGIGVRTLDCSCYRQSNAIFGQVRILIVFAQTGASAFSRNTGLAAAVLPNVLPSSKPA